MTTVDGTVSFSGQLQCPNSQRFMEVLIQPGATGDIATFIVSQDTTFSGNLNYTYEVPFPVSGLCANGVIACTPGTWTNCQTYQWTSNGSEQVSLAVVPSRPSEAASASTTRAEQISSSTTPRPS